MTGTVNKVNAREMFPHHESVQTSISTNVATISSDSFKSTLPFLVRPGYDNDEVSLLTFDDSISKERNCSFDGKMWLKRNISCDSDLSEPTSDSDNDSSYTRISI